MVKHVTVGLKFI